MADLAHLFDGVLSSTMPTHFASKGCALAALARGDPEVTASDSWALLGAQLLVDDSIEAIESVWSEPDGRPREPDVLANTLRIPQYSRTGLVEEDFALIDSLLTSVFALGSQALGAGAVFGVDLLACGGLPLAGPPGGEKSQCARFWGG